MREDIDDNARIVAERMRRQRIVPFLGAGVNLADRADGASWSRGVDLPSGAELAETLATSYPYPRGEPTQDLMRVSQYVESRVGESAVYDEFREVFTGPYRPTIVHKVLAQAPSLLAAKGVNPPYLLIVTTNYDDAQEQAFEAAGEEYDLLWYMAHGDHRGLFIHQPPGGEPTPVDDPARCALSVAERNVILKIHGAAHRVNERFDSFVVTEDDYIEYMTAPSLKTAVPVELMTTMVESHFLFLGYGLGDWNLRVFLHGLWESRSRVAMNWAVNLHHRELDRLFWQKRSVEIIEAPLATYMAALDTALQAR